MTTPYVFNVETLFALATRLQCVTATYEKEGLVSMIYTRTHTQTRLTCLALISKGGERKTKGDSKCHPTEPMTITFQNDDFSQPGKRTHLLSKY